MNQTERLYKIEQMLSESRAVPVETFLERLQISRATFKRDLDYLRDRLNAPIVWDREMRGYRFDARSGKAGRGGPKHELPGLWFNASEAYALLAMQQLLKDIEPGLLAGQVEPLKARLRALLGSTDHDIDQVEKRIRLVQVGARRAKPALFAEVANAVLSRRQIRITYYSRGSGEETDRTISPQRLVNYRGNWYVDAWCHLREDLRSFSVDSIRKADVLNDRAKAVPEKDLKEYVETSYGIFRGKATKVAKLRFTPERARWVAGEVWHPQQRGSFAPDGTYLLEVPYHDDRELIMDVLRHGAEVEVLAPPSLRTRIVKALRDALEPYFESRELANAPPRRSDISGK
ncbi:MAG: YafY family transcriptional regulator [Burkholderiales bacterium]|nr:YafY family transcriptional regulator [Burkholderiales bacterium]